MNPVSAAQQNQLLASAGMVHGQGKSRPVAILDLQTGEVKETLPSVAAVAKTFFKETKDCTARNRVQKALDKAQASGNSYSTLVTDVPGYVAGFAWAQLGKKVIACRCKLQQWILRHLGGLADKLQSQVCVRHVPTGCLAAIRAQTSCQQQVAPVREVFVEPARKPLAELPVPGNWPEQTRKLWSSRLCTFEASAYADTTRFPDQK